MADLDSYRVRIDEIDKEITKLFEERMNDETFSEARRNTAKYKYETAVQNINDLQEKL